MPRNYVRKTDRGSYGSEALRAALDEISKGASLNSTANKFRIDRKTLRRHRDHKVNAPGTISLGRFKPEFSTNFEEALCIKIKDMESMLFGLTVMDIRRLAFDLAEYLGLNHRFNNSSKLAGKDWLAGFMKRNPSISIRRPEAVSLARAVGFNRPQVEKFFTCYKSLLESSNFSACKIWNMDETGISCVQRPTKILAEKGKKSVGKITSAERGKNITAICAFNAAGSFIPPMLIFPRKRLPPAMMHGAPPESLGSCSDNGWSDAEQFLKWLDHFVKHARSTKEYPQIILLDGHHSHKTLRAVEFATEHGVHMLTLPPHCTHKMQPCDRSFFKPLKSAYNAAADAWMVSHPAQRITFFDVAGIFGQAYTRSATIAVAVNGFAACGLWPYNDRIFTEADFAPSQVTDQPDPAAPSQTIPSPIALATTSVPTLQTTAASGPTSSMPTSTASTTSAPEPHPASLLITPVPPTLVPTHLTPPQETSTLVPAPIPSVSMPLPSVPSTSQSPTTARAIFVPPPAVASTSEQVIVEELYSSPKATKVRKRTRKAESAQILTASPYKRSLIEAAAKKRQPKKTLTKGKGKGKKTARGKKEESSGSEEDEYPCLVCGEDFASSKPGEKWIACIVCGRWSHEECTPGMGLYVCQNCESEYDSD